MLQGAGGTVGPMGRGQGGSEKWGDGGFGTSFVRPLSCGGRHQFRTEMEGTAET